MTHRVAAIIPNYNMPERTDALVRYIRKRVKSYPVDVIVVDNASDLVKPSKFTNVYLSKNTQTTGGWLAGLDALNRQYFAYWFLITSTEFAPLQSFDPLMPMVAKLKNDDQAVGVHNALTTDSTTAWKHLITRGGIGCRQTWMLDNISSLYRAEWFDGIGRFDPELIYGWGVDLETCYIARQQERTLWVCEDAKVKKITDVGYRLERMNMDSEERKRLARINMRDILSRKYGENWSDLMFGRNVDDSLK
jgi:GT2 family glycosyltransferase